MILITKKQIQKEVKRLAEEITNDYSGLNPLLMGVLKGSFMFLADLVRNMDMRLEIDFIELSSYLGTTSTGKVEILKLPRTETFGRHVIIVEDIVDTGLTIACLKDKYDGWVTQSLTVCTLLDKPSRRVIPVHIDYTGFEIEDKFVVGYGLDHDGQYRNKPDIHILEE